MLFIDPSHQKKGIGMRLMFLTLTYARVDAVTVNAVLTSVSAYEKYGFECSGDA